MQRVTLYSSSRRAPARSGKDAPGPGAPTVPAAPTPATAEGAPASASATASRWRSVLARHDRWLLFVAGALVALLALAAYQASLPAPRKITQQDIEDAVLKALETSPLPSYATRAYEIIAPSVVRVRGFGTGRDGIENTEVGVGTGVVIVDNGLILTNLHVVAGADAHRRGLRTTAWSPTPRSSACSPSTTSRCIRAKKIPDDLVAATLRSTGGLAARRRGRRGRLSLRHRPVGVGRRRSPASTASTTRRAASACSPT